MFAETVGRLDRVEPAPVSLCLAGYLLCSLTEHTNITTINTQYANNLSRVKDRRARAGK